MDLHSQLNEANDTMIARLEAYQAALANFRERPDDQDKFRVAEEASFCLLNALVELNKNIMNCAAASCGVSELSVADLSPSQKR